MDIEISLNANKTHDTKILSAFPGVGKSHFASSNSELVVSDSDSSKFPKDGFPQNYITHIQSLIGNVDYALVSSHDNVRQGLVDAGLDFTLIYPDMSEKDVYMERYRERGSPEGFLTLMDSKWNDFVQSCAEQTGCKHIVLKDGQYLSDVI